jgi:hypothetical protein
MICLVPERTPRSYYPILQAWGYIAPIWETTHKGSAHTTQKYPLPFPTHTGLSPAATILIKKLHGRGHINSTPSSPLWHSTSLCHQNVRAYVLVTTHTIAQKFILPVCQQLIQPQHQLNTHMRTIIPSSKVSVSSGTKQPCLKCTAVSSISVLLCWPANSK